MRIINFCSRRRSALTAIALAAIALAPLGACSTETLLESEDPDLIDPAATRSPAGALGLRNGALGRFKNITGGSESTWLFGGLLADEWSTSSTFIQNDETDQRRIQLNNSSITGMFRDLARVRTATNQAIAAMKEFNPDSTAMIAELYFARGFAEMQLAQDFCNGIPLSDGSGEEIVFGQPLTIDSVFKVAIASYDSALALIPTIAVTPTDSVITRADSLIHRAARIGKARALLGLGRFAEAGALVSATLIPTTYAYNHTFAVSSGRNTLWNQPFSQRRYTVSDSLEGNSRNILVKNAIPFFSAKDPRLPVTYSTSNAGKDTTKGQDGFTFSRRTSLYADVTPVAVVNGIDARLIEAEAALKANDPVTMLAILNALRAARPTVGTITPAAGSLAPLVDPVTQKGREDLLFREKAFWTFTRGQRLGDLRRLIRQYGRTPETTFPEGVHYRGGTYGPDVNLPVPFDEQNNPNFTGCINRNA
jgi:starch-binding outer membrane protein, SusD/RagB family